MARGAEKYQYDRVVRIDHPEEDHRVYLQRDVIASDDVLRRDFESFLPQRHAHDAVYRGEYQNHSRTLCSGKEAPQAEDDSAFILRQNFDGTD